MLVCTQGLMAQHAVLKPYLSLMLRDDLISWHASKTSPKTELEQRQIEKLLQDRMTKNVSKVMDRFDGLCAKQGRRDMQTGRLIPADSKVHELIAAATDAENLGSLNPNWMAWV